MCPGPVSLAQGSVVRLRGLPSKTTKEDVLTFLAGFGLPGPTNIHLAFKERRSAGEAYVVFDRVEEAQKACSKDKDIFSPKFGDRYVRVAIAEGMSPDDLHNLGGPTSKTVRSRRARQTMESVVKVGGLPSGITLPEVLQLFWGFAAKVPATHIQPAAGNSAEAFVEFEVVEHAGQAVATRHGTMVTTAAGIFQLTVQQACRAEWEAVVAAKQGSDGIVKMKGLPTKATAADVLAFFQGFCVKEGGVHVQPLSRNRHSKVALVEFETVAEAVRALDKDRQRFGDAFGDRYCLLQLAHRAEFEQDLASFQKQLSGGGGGGTSSSSGTQGSGATSSLPGLPSSSAMGMLPHAVGAAPWFMQHPALPSSMSAGMMLPAGYTLPPGLAAMPGSWPAAAAAQMQQYLAPAMAASMGVMPLLPLGTLPAPGALAAAPGGGGMPWPGMPLIGNTAAARYMVQDLTTGQKVYLDPRFNLSGYGAPPPGIASCSAAATAGTTTLGTGPTGRSEPAGPPADRQARSQVTMSENSTGQESSGQGTTGKGNSNGNGHSVAVADGNGTGGGPGVSTGHGAPAKGGSGKANGSSGQSGETKAGEDGEQPQGQHRQSRRTEHHHHHHSHHYHHYHHHGRKGAAAGSSGDEERDGSGGGSNDGSDGGSGADEPRIEKSGGDNSSGNERGNGDGSNGEGSGADDGGTAGAGAAGGSLQCPRICATRLAAAAAAMAAGCTQMEEDGFFGATAVAGQAAEATATLQKQKDCTRQLTAEDAAALLQDGVALPLVKRTRSQ